LDRKLDFHVISKDIVPLEEQFWYIWTSLKLGNRVALPAGKRCGTVWPPFCIGLWHFVSPVEDVRLLTLWHAIFTAQTLSYNTTFQRFQNKFFRFNSLLL
jgi:hypothetical protein